MTVPHQRAQQTRDVILRAAAREFERNGYTATSLSAILDGSGVTKGAFYFHFASKESVAAAVVDTMHTRWAPALRRWADSNCDALQVVLGLVDELTLYCATDQMVRAGLRLTTEHRLTVPDLLAPFPEWERIFGHLFQRAEITGLLGPGVRPVTAAHVLVSGLAGERLAVGLAGDAQALRVRTDELLEVLMPAFACPSWTAQWRASGWQQRPLPVLVAPMGARLDVGGG